MPVVDSNVLSALRTQEMAGERWAAYLRLAFFGTSILGFVVTHRANTAAASQAFGILLVAYGLYAATICVVLRNRERYFPRLKFITIALDILFVYAQTWPILHNYSGIYGIYRAPLLWTLLAAFNALSGLRYSARASVFAGLFTIGLGIVQLVMVSFSFSQWTESPLFIGEGLHVVSCVFTFLLAATPAGFAAVVAHQSRRLVIREAQQSMERDAVEERHRDTLEEVESLREVADAKDRFLGIASHELRSPVTALRGTIELIQHDPAALTDPKLRERMTARMERQSVRLVKLVRQLLDSAQLTHPVSPLDISECDLVQVCKQALEGLEGEAAARVDVHAAAPIVGHWDASRLEQVITNLVSNAVRYSPAEARVEVRVSGDAQRATVEVIDHGIGIPAKQLDQVFSPFFRAANAPGAERSGLGLGLYISNEIVRRHDGAVRVRSQEGQGTTFTVELPRTPTSRS